MTNYNTFADLPLSKPTIKGLKDSNYITLTDIQKQSIPPALQGNDLLGAAKTGSGKTLAFLIPVIELLYKNQWTRLDGIGALIITPTRELAYQIYETLRKIGRYHDFSAGLIIGGKDLHFEKRRIDKCNILICTPGRLLQHMDENPLFDCVNMKILVLDEADRCLDMGFEKTMNSIIENLPPERRTLLFSATQTKSVKDLARLSLKDPLYVSVHEFAAHATPEGLQQTYVVCELEEKMSMLWSFIKTHLKQKIIVFLSSCKQVKFIFEAFCRMKPGMSLLALYGSLHQLKRMNIYESFHKKESAILFATDIAARGLDFPDVNWVVQMDCPEDVNAYIHRSGRTARFKSGGESLLVLLPTEVKFIDYLKERTIPITLIKINADKLFSPQRKLEAMLARDVELKETAKRAFVAYIKSVFLMKDKSVFTLQNLNTDAFARSLGLAIPPRIRFLQRNQKNIPQRKDEKSRIDKSIEMPESEVSEHSEEKYNDTLVRSKNRSDYSTTNIFSNVQIDDKDEGDFLTIKRKNIQIDCDDLPPIDSSFNSNKKKPVTKAAIVKKILKKKIVPNKKVNFDEEGQEIPESKNSRVSELAKQYENDETPGINIELAKKVLREEDAADKQRFREKVKEKHREKKKKLKAKKSKAQNDLDDHDSVSEESGSEPDLSWLPDPDKIYGPERVSDDENKSSFESDNTESFKEQNKKSNKRKENYQNDRKSKKRKQITSVVNSNMQAAEELALQLLHS